MYDSGPWGKSSTKDISVVDKFIDSLQRHNFIYIKKKQRKRSVSQFGIETAEG